MSDRSLQVSVEDLQHIQLHLEGQEQALAAIAEHLRAFDSDAGQFVHFQSDFIKTIGLIQDVHQHTKQQAQQWREQLEQCSTAHQNTLQLQADTASELSASTERLSNELKTTLQQQQHYFEQIKAAMAEHENLLSTHQSIALFKEIPNLIHQMSQRLNNALTQVDTVFVGMSNLKDQHLRYTKQLAAIMEKQFADMQSLLIAQYTERDKENKNLHALTHQHLDQGISDLSGKIKGHVESLLRVQATERDQKLDQRFSDLSNLVEQNLEKLQQDQKNHQLLFKAAWIFCVFFILVLFAYQYMQQKKEVSRLTPLPVLEKKAISATQSGSQDIWVDRESHLMWLNCGLGQTWQEGRCNGDLTAYTWSEAQALVSAINQNGSYAGYTDWRLPYIAELFTTSLCRSGYTSSTRIPSRDSGSIVVRSHCRQANAPLVFWSNTVSPNSASFAYSLDYGNSTTKLSSTGQRYFVTLVRNP